MDRSHAIFASPIASVNTSSQLEQEMEATTSGGRSSGVEVSFSSSQKTSVSGGGSAILPSGSGANVTFFATVTTVS
jgi:hypothetical protein